MFDALSPYGRGIGGRRVMCPPEAIRDSEHFDIVPCGPVLGAEIRGLDLNSELSPALVADLKRAFLDWKVLFFRDQSLTARAHVDLARQWGEPIRYPLPDTGELPEIVRVEHGPRSPGVENVWHSDVSYQEIPALGSILHAITVPPYGGDTLWADMTAAYDGLPEEIRQRVDGLVAEHDFLARYQDHDSLARAKAARDMFPVHVHPVVRVHPETGRRILYVNRTYTTRILSLDEPESTWLVDLLCGQAYHPEYQVRFQWSPGAVALWDNRATQHYATSDYYPHHRLMERVTIAGDRPA